MKELAIAEERAREIALHGPTGAPEPPAEPPTVVEALQEAWQATEKAGRLDLQERMVTELLDIIEDALRRESRYGGQL